MKSEWRTCQADEFCYAVTDGTHDSPKAQLSGRYLITSKHLKGNRIDFASANKISEEDYQKVIKRSPVQQWDILYSMIGTIGNVYLEKNPITEYACKNMGIFKFSGKKDSAIWLYYYLQSPLAKEYIQSHLRGSTQAYVPLGSLRELPVLVPPERIRNRIISVLTSLDNKIELNQKINENLERQVQAIFKSWFVDFEPFGGEIPADWRYVDFSKFLTASAEKSNDPFLPMFSVTDKGIFPRDEKFKKNLSMTNLKSKVVHQTDLVFGMSREILNWGIMRDPIGGVSSAYNVYHVNEEINTFYLESYMKANYKYFKDLIKPASREGQGIDKNALMQKEILLPPPAILEQYYSIENALTQTASHVLAEIQRLAEIRDTLLPKLMSGEIDVSNIQP